MSNMLDTAVLSNTLLLSLTTNTHTNTHTHTHTHIVTKGPVAYYIDL